MLLTSSLLTWAADTWAVPLLTSPSLIRLLGHILGRLRFSASPLSPRL